MKTYPAFNHAQQRKTVQNVKSSYCWRSLHYIEAWVLWMYSENSCKNYFAYYRTRHARELTYNGPKVYTRDRFYTTAGEVRTEFSRVPRQFVVSGRILHVHWFRNDVFFPVRSNFTVVPVKRHQRRVFLLNRGIVGTRSRYFKLFVSGFPRRTFTPRAMIGGKKTR